MIQEEGSIAPRVAALRAWGRRWARRYEGPLWLGPLLRLGYRRTLEAVLQGAGVEDRRRVVDLGAGTGIAARLASPRLPPGGVVVAVDLSPELVAEGRRRARAEGRTNVHWLLAEASHLPLRSGWADALISTGAFHLFPRPLATLAEVARVLAPGGVAALHAVPRRFPFTLVHRLLRRPLREAIALPTAEALAAWAAAAGLGAIEVAPVPLGLLLRARRP